MTTTIHTTAADTDTAEPGVRARIGSVREVAAGVGGALTTGGRAYVAGVFEIGRTLGGLAAGS